MRISFSFGGGSHRPPRRHHGGYNVHHYDNGVTVRTKGSPILMTIIFFIVAAALIVGGIFSNISHQKKLETYQPINAIITDYREDVDYDSDDGTYDYTYFPIYTFEVDGRKYIVEDNIGSSSFPHFGERELILYNPEDPYQITHVNNTGGTVMIVIGCIFLGVTVILIVVSIVNKKKRSEYLREEETRYDNSTDSEPVRTNYTNNPSTPQSTSNTSTSTNCAGCGSPKVSGQTNCPYCGTHY